MLSRGYLAVDFFFTLSGFVLARAHTQPFGLSSYRDFLIKRIARLFPMHWVVLVFCLIGLFVFHVARPWWVYVVGEFALVHCWAFFPASLTAVNVPDWSISTEWGVNLLFPGFIWVARRPATGLVAAVGFAFAIFLIARANHFSMDINAARSWLPLVRCASEFGFGVLLARYPGSRWMGNDVWIAVLLMALAIALVVQVDLLAVPVFVALIAALAISTGKIANTLSAGPPYWLGKVSYSIYLTQIPTLVLVRWVAVKSPLAGPIFYLVGTVAAVLIVSWGAYHWIELPGIKVGKQMLRWTGPRAMNSQRPSRNR